MKWLFVIARNSSFAYKGRAVDVKQIGRELGVRYVLEGSVRKAADKVRITGQLINAATGAHIWADRFDGRLAEILLKNSKIAEPCVFVIGTKYRKPPRNLLALTYRRIRIARNEVSLPPRPEFPKPSLSGGNIWARGK